MNLILFALWFFLPAGLANAAPVFANKIPLLNRWKAPMDFGKSYGSTRLLGKNKTWRGFFFGATIAALTALLQAWLMRFDTVLRLAAENSDYLILMQSSYVWIGIFGALLGCGALLGDAVESFFKRRSGIASGESWLGFDQTDYIIGGLIFATPFVVFSPAGYIMILAVWFGAHILSSYIGFLLHLKDKPI